MAKTYQGYADRGEVAAAPQLDWRALSTEINKGLAANEADREAQRTAIDEDTRKTNQAAGEYTLGQNQTMNDVVIDGSSAMKKEILAMETMMKSGQIEPKDFTKFKQNAAEGWSNLNAVNKTWNESYALMEKRVNEGISGEQERAMNEYKGQLEDIANTKMVFDKKGNMVLYKTDKNGEIIPGSQTDIRSMTKVPNMIADKFSVKDAVTDHSSKLGVFVKSIEDGRGTVEDIAESPQYKDVSNAVVSAILTDNRTVGSVLADNMGGYTMTTDPSKVNKDTILLKLSPNGIWEPQITAPQKKAAEKYVHDVLLGSLAHKESLIRNKPTVSNPGEAARVKLAGQTKEKKIKLAKDYELMSGLFGDEKAFNATANLLQTKDPNIASITRDDEKLTISYVPDEDGVVSPPISVDMNDIKGSTRAIMTLVGVDAGEAQLAEDAFYEAGGTDRVSSGEASKSAIIPLEERPSLSDQDIIVNGKSIPYSEAIVKAAGKNAVATTVVSSALSKILPQDYKDNVTVKFNKKGMFSDDTVTITYIDKSGEEITLVDDKSIRGDIDGTIKKVANYVWDDAKK